MRTRLHTISGVSFTFRSLTAHIAHTNFWRSAHECQSSSSFPLETGGPKFGGRAAIGTLLTHAAAVHGIAVFPEEVRLARVALVRLGLVGKAHDRDWRPRQRELNVLIRHFDERQRQLIPMSRIIRFVVATAMRQEEICSITWDGVEIRITMVGFLRGSPGKRCLANRPK